MKKNTFLGIAGLLLGFAGCGASDPPCAPSGTWSVTTSPAADNDCAAATESTDTEVVTTTNGTTTITDSDGSTHVGSLDGACHMAFINSFSFPEIVGTGSTDWTFTGATLSGTVTENITATADGSMCTLKETLVGVRH